MNELKPEDVMGALECCNTKGNCNQCPYEIVGEYTACYSVLTQDALALLREKDARIEQLLGDIRATVELANKGAAEKDAEIERLKADNLYGLSASELAKKVEEISQENERLKNSITFQVVMPDDKMEEIKAECLKRVELDIKAIKAEAIADVVAQLEAEVDSSDKYISEYDGSKVQVAYNKGLRNALKIVKEMEACENGKTDL